jgi:hypothetical protein
MLRPRSTIGGAVTGRIGWTRSGERLVFGSSDGARCSLVVVSTADGSVVERFSAMRPYVAVAAARDDAYFVCADAAGGIDLVRPGVVRHGAPPVAHRGRINAVTFSADDRWFYTASDEGTVARFTAATWEARVFDAGGAALDVAELDGGRIAVALGKGGLVILESGGRRLHAPAIVGRVTSVAVVGDALVAGTREGRLHFLDAATIAARGAIELGVGPIARVAALAGCALVEGGLGIVALVDGAMRERGRMLAGGAATLAVHAGSRAFAVAGKSGVLVGEAELPVAEIEAPRTLAIFAPADADAARDVIAVLRERGLSLDIATDRRAIADASRSFARAVIFYGRDDSHGWTRDLLRARGVAVVPVALPGGTIPVDGDVMRHVYFGARDDVDAVDRVVRLLR